MNIERTKKFYDSLGDDYICTCDYCQNYAFRVKKAYPEVSEYLEKIGIDIEKPFETNPVEPKDGMLLYDGVQYIVFGSKDDFKEEKVDDVKICISDLHPDTCIKDEEHFVILIAPIILKYGS